MESKAIFEAVKARFGDAAIELQEEGFHPPFLVVSSASVREIAFFLRDDPGMRFDSLMCLSGVDYKDRFAVAYHLHSLEVGHKIGVKAYLPRETPALPSVDPVWPAANFQEREAFDLYGIVFEGSRDLRRILLPEDWEGHPLRKDYKYPDFYHGIKV
ncbi:MAG TPA: NADH-quinone oxidoreductase subunit C [Candidatus Deferrimicrobiaceae bacterium]|nr:NADH-quinone oxidoreductase subunit C [Candidatus Deferrimicrobiaceae bacterium]